MNSFGRDEQIAEARSLDLRKNRHLIALLAEWLLNGFGFEQVSALRRGFRIGYRAGIEQALQDAALDNEAAPAVQPSPLNTLFGNTHFEITPEMEATIRADVASRISEKEQPSADQWKLILSRTPTTSVIAGAGSGKL